MERAAASSCAVSTTPAQSSAAERRSGARSPLYCRQQGLHLPDDGRAVVGRRRVASTARTVAAASDGEEGAAQPRGELGA